MGSFTSKEHINRKDHQDDDLVLTEEELSRKELLLKFQTNITFEPIKRKFLVLNPELKSDNKFRLLHWNILSQTIGKYFDGFDTSPEHTMDWNVRKYTLLYELTLYNADILCLQEVDHFNFLSKTLKTQGYEGIFFNKPHSPCLHADDNNGPDGCAIFYSTERYDLIKHNSEVLYVWTVETNQVVLSVILKDKISGEEICVTTTHLKARNEACLPLIRKEQGAELLRIVRMFCGNRSVVITGDFNANSSEPVYKVMKNDDLGLESAYFDGDQEPEFTSWKIRRGVEHKESLDYVFYQKKHFAVERILRFPKGKDIGETRLPNLNYPSDHLSLVCDFIPSNDNN